MIDPQSLSGLRNAIRAQVAGDRVLLDQLRKEIRELKTSVRRIQPRATTSISLVGTDGGNNKLQFDPFLVQLVRVVDSSNNEYCLEVVSPTTNVKSLSQRQFDANGQPRTALGKMMAYLGVNDLTRLSSMIRTNDDDRPVSPSWVQVYRELVEWAILFSILREKDFGTDTIIVCDGLLRSKVYTSPRQVIAAAKRILNAVKTPREVPTGDFWRLAFRNTVLETLCRLREGLLASCESDTRKALRAVILGALHGPRTKQFPSYFSNQSPRTYSPKPGYAVKFWTDRNLVPPNVDALDIITRRAQRFFGEEFTTAEGSVVAGDSRMLRVFRHVREKIGWIVTSPPYYGMRTYIPDQWLRRWFLGGPTHVDYSSRKQLSHASQKKFCEGLKTVWTNCANVADPGCRLVIRFGAINDRKVSSLHLLKESLQGTEWRIQTCRRAGTATSGKRQAEHFVSAGAAIEEYDLWAALA